jgi:hypothetical protein
MRMCTCNYSDFELTLHSFGGVRCGEASVDWRWQSREPNLASPRAAPKHLTKPINFEPSCQHFLNEASMLDSYQEEVPEMGLVWWNGEMTCSTCSQHFWSMCSPDPCTVRNWRAQTPMLDRCEPSRGCFTVAATVALLLPYCCVLLCVVLVLELPLRDISKTNATAMFTARVALCVPQQAHVWHRGAMRTVRTLLASLRLVTSTSATTLEIC